MDLHVHSNISFDGKNSYMEIAAAAVKKGLDAVAITDHCDLYQTPSGYEQYLERYASSLEQLADTQNRYENSVSVLRGIEIGNPQRMPDLSKEILSTYPYDFVIGAIHYWKDRLDYLDLDYSDPKKRRRYLEEYYTDVLALVRWGCFDSLAHLNYPWRAMRACEKPSTVTEYRDLILPILSSLVEKDLSLEINTRGMYDWQNTIDPENWILQEYFDMGGRKITVGSDAHTINFVGAGIETGIDEAKAVGFPFVYFYRQREPIAVPIR